MIRHTLQWCDLLIRHGFLQLRGIDQCILCTVAFCDNGGNGENVTIGNNVKVYPQVYIGERVRIGRNCWIGAGAVILPGVTVGDDTVIGAGSVVTKDIPAGVVAVGNPCRVLRPIGEHDREYYFRDRRIPPALLNER